MENMVYNVKNRSSSMVVYSIPEAGIRREFTPGETKRISGTELEQLSYKAGGRALMEDYLFISSDKVIEDLGLHTEQEYYMNEQQVVELIKNGSYDEWLDALDFAPIGVIDLIKKLSISIPMVDIPKRKALKEKTGFDVEAALKHNEEDKEDTQKTILKTNNNGERRVQPNAAPAGRRTAPPVTAPAAAAPRYNVVNKNAEEAKAESAE